MTKDEVYELIDRYERMATQKLEEDIENLRRVVYQADSSDVRLGGHKLGFGFDFDEESSLEVWSQVPFILMPIKKENDHEEG